MKLGNMTRLGTQAYYSCTIHVQVILIKQFIRGPVRAVEGIIDRFQNLLFSGFVLQTLMIARDGRQPDTPAPTPVRCLRMTRRGAPLDGLVEYRAEVNDECIIPRVKYTIKGPRRS